MRDGVDDYDLDDDLIDNTDLEHKFRNRAIAKHKHKKQRTAGCGFRIDNNLDKDDVDEDGGDEDGDDDDDDEEEDDNDDDDEMGEGGTEGVSRGSKEGSRNVEKRQGPKRRRRRQWLADGDKNFREVTQVQVAIESKLGNDGEKLSDGMVRVLLLRVVQRLRENPKTQAQTHGHRHRHTDTDTDAETQT